MMTNETFSSMKFRDETEIDQIALSICLNLTLVSVIWSDVNIDIVKETFF